MVIVDTALAKRHSDNNPVEVALVGAGFMGRGNAIPTGKTESLFIDIRFFGSQWLP